MHHLFCGYLFFQAEDGIRDLVRSRGLGDVYKRQIYFLLLLGSFTPLYEINRSAYRTFEYYFLLDASQRVKPTSEVVTHLEQPGAPESEHPNMLVADEIQTFKFMDDKLSKNFIANVRQSLYYRYLSPH